MRLKSKFLAGTVVAGVMAIAPLTGAGAASACPKVAGSNLGALTFDQIADLPQTQLAIDAGILTRAEAISFYVPLDRNGDGLLCVHYPPGWDKTQSKIFLDGLDAVSFIVLTENAGSTGK